MSITRKQYRETPARKRKPKPVAKRAEELSPADVERLAVLEQRIAAVAKELAKINRLC